MLVLRCSNGHVLVTVLRLKEQDQLRFHFLADQFNADAARTDAGITAGLQAVVQHAVSLKGALQQIVDLPEIT